MSCKTLRRWEWGQFFVTKDGVFDLSLRPTFFFFFNLCLFWQNTLELTLYCMHKYKASSYLLFLDKLWNQLDLNAFVNYGGFLVPVSGVCWIRVCKKVPLLWFFLRRGGFVFIFQGRFVLWRWESKKQNTREVASRFLNGLLPLILAQFQNDFFSS